jgi:hypothetical protein
MEVARLYVGASAAIAMTLSRDGLEKELSPNWPCLMNGVRMNKDL